MDGEKSRKHRYDDYEGVRVDISLAVEPPARVVGVDVLNGRERDLTFRVDGDRLTLPDVVLLDYSHFLRLEY